MWYTKHMFSKSKIAKNTAFNFLGQGSAMFLALLVTPYLISKLGIIQYGVWVLLSVITNYYNVVDFGMSGSYVRFIAEDKARNDFDGINRIVSTALCYNTAFGAFIVFSGMLGKPLIMRLFVRDASQAGMIDAIYLPALLLFSFNYVGNVFQSLLDGIQRMDVRNVAQITQKVIQVVLIVVFLEKGMGLAGLIMSGFIANGIFLVGSYALAKYLVPQFTLGFSLVDGHKFKSMFSYGLKSQVTNLCAWSNNNANKLILGASGMLTGVAYFDVAQKLETFVRTPPVSLFSSLIPAVSESHTLEDRSRLEALYRKASVALVRLIFPLCFFVLFNAAYITQSWVDKGRIKSDKKR